MSKVELGVVAAALVLSSCIRIHAVVVQDDVGPAVVFDAVVPAAPNTMRVYTLGAGHPELTAVNCPEVPQPVVDPGVTAAPMTATPKVRVNQRERGSLECPIDARRVETIEPHLPKPDALAGARKVAAGFVPAEDRSTSATLPIRMLYHLRAEGSTGVDPANKPEPTLLYVPVQRMVEHYPVDGPGSRVAVVTDPDGNALGATLLWRTKSQPRALEAVRDATQVRMEIRRQLESLHLNTPARVQQIDLVYYDGDRKLLQPAYRYVAEVRGDSRSIGHADHIVGYVAYAETDEALPKLSGQRLASADKSIAAVARQPATTSSGTEEIRVGRYVTRDDHSGWAEDARAFGIALQAYNIGLPFVNSQFRYARPEHFTHESKQYVDSVDLALVEAHGQPWMFATYRSEAASVVSLNGPHIARHGYGPNVGGRLRHLALHSCDVVPGPDERDSWQTPWRNLIRTGVQTILGYRTPMLINDGAGAAFGERLARGESVVFSWLTAVTSLSAYGLSSSGKFVCEGNVPMGRPIAIVACGASGAAVNERPQVTPDCMEVWWIGDELTVE